MNAKRGWMSAFSPDPDAIPPPLVEKPKKKPVKGAPAPVISGPGPLTGIAPTSRTTVVRRKPFGWSAG